jgi:Spy/CpxP family protein refolding chaperone
MNLRLLLALTAILTTPLLRAQTPPGDPVGSKLFAPEFIGANAGTISLSESQQEKMRGIVEQAQARIVEFGTKVKAAADGFGKLIDGKDADISKAMAQFEKFQDAERDMKHAQLRLLLELREMLSEEQRTWLTQIKTQQAGQFRERNERIKTALTKLRQIDPIVTEALKLIESAVLPGQPAQAQQIQEKMERVQVGADKWQGEGRDPAPIAEIMQQVGPLVNAGKVQEANALLDRALKLIESGGK